jgi:hypothetical protein
MALDVERILNGWPRNFRDATAAIAGAGHRRSFWRRRGRLFEPMVERHE